jgi:23S rRNA (guanosine2251-2'-O)-methyltransferase
VKRTERKTAGQRGSARFAEGRKGAGQRTTEMSREAFIADDFVSGRHPVLEALKAGRPINKILVADTSEGGSLIEILGKARAAGIVVQKVPKANLVRIAGEHHQGVVALMAPHEYVDIDDIIAKQTGQAPLVVLLDEVSDPHNLGAILRSAEATGAQGVIIPKRRAVPLTGVVAKAAAGALEYVPVARVTNLVSAIETLKKAGYWIVGTALEASQRHTEVDYRGPIAIVIGAEGQGLSRLVKEKCDFLVQIPMLGHLQSLNASVAAGVMLYEVVRQRA